MYSEKYVSHITEPWTYHFYFLIIFVSVPLAMVPIELKDYSGDTWILASFRQE